MAEFPKLVIVSDGQHTAALLNGIYLGPKINRLEFSADADSGAVSIRLLDIQPTSYPPALGQTNKGGLKPHDSRTA